jgi:hypothetical protein
MLPGESCGHEALTGKVGISVWEDANREIGVPGEGVKTGIAVYFATLQAGNTS